MTSMRSARPRLALFLSLALCPLVASAAAPRVHSTAPKAPATKAPETTKTSKAKPRTAGKATKIPRASARAAAVEPVANPEGSAAMAALLRQFVDGKTGAFDKTLAAKLAKHGVSKAAATKLLGRIDAASASSRKQTFGSASTKSAPGKAQLGKLVASQDIRSKVMSLMEVITLPPQGIPAPSAYEMKQTGLVTLSTEDGDGSDELTMFAIMAYPTGGDDYTLQSIVLGSGQTAAPGAQALTKRTIFDGPARDALLVSVLVEDDGGNAAQAKAEIEMLVGLAASVAATMPGTDRLQVLQTMVDYTIGLDAVGADPGRATRSVATTTIGQDDWFALWGADASDHAGIGYKIAVPHAMNGGNYELLLDVPGTPPKMPTVRVQVSSAVFEAFGNPDRYALDRIRLDVGIGDESFRLSLEDWSVGTQPAIERKVVDGNVAVWMKANGKVLEIVPQWLEDFCAKAKSEKEIRRCHRLRDNYRGKITQDFDLAGGSPQMFSADYDTKAHGFVKATDTKNPSGTSSSTSPSPSPPLTTKTAKGDKTPIGTVKIKASSFGG